MPKAQDGGVRRQERGLLRMESILDAAERVIATDGLEGVTTNQIAVAAGISPGSLYQYFANKGAIVEGLARRYLDVYTAAADRPRTVGVDRGVDVLVDRLVDPLVEFNLAHPAARFLLASADLHPELALPGEVLHTALRERVGALVGEVAPERDRRGRAAAADLSIQIVGAALPSILKAKAHARSRMLEELKIALRAYWSALAKEDGADRQ